MGVELAAESAVSNEMEGVTFSDSELVRHVRDALNSVLLGDVDSYNELIGVIHHTEQLAPDERALLVTSLKALSGAVSCIDVSYHESLLNSIFRMSLWHFGPDVMDALVELIISLATSSGKHVDSCLDMLVNNFIPPYYFLDQLKQPRGIAKKEQVLSRVHSALTKIAELFPLSPMRLLPIINQRMPYITWDESFIVIYVENMLRLETSAIRGIVGSTILMALVDRLIDLDVEIGWDEISQDDSSKGMFFMELEDVGIADDADKDRSELPGESLSGKHIGGKVADKLDSLMVLTFEHLKSCDDAGRLSEVFETLLQSFKITVLNAYKSKFTQFVMFYACSLDPENCGVRFATMLADIFVGTDPPLTRMSAVAYLASYVSRGKFLSPSLVNSILKRLVEWCFKYSQVQDGHINPKAHRVFYSGCQGIMYILCFRMRSMIDVPRLKSELFLMPIEQILKHPLGPLQVCLPTIVQEFLRQAKAVHLFTVSETFIFNDVLESELSRAFGGLERLDMFFPFDPYLLKKSDRFIRPKFVFWSMVRPTYDDDEEGSSDEDVGEDYADEIAENVRDYGMAKSFEEEHDLDLDDFDYSLNQMSITPKNSLNYMFNGELNPMQMPSRIRPSTSPESL